ncbi:MAG TPA: hypothetical protein VIV60_23295 [Polyangiaceae bacterium]
MDELFCDDEVLPPFADDDELEPPCDELPPADVDLATHEPLLQVCELLQTFPQEPQLFGSNLVSVHVVAPGHAVSEGFAQVLP